MMINKLLNTSFVGSHFHVSDPMYHKILIRRKAKTINKIKILATYLYNCSFPFLMPYIITSLSMPNLTFHSFLLLRSCASSNLFWLWFSQGFPQFLVLHRYTYLCDFPNLILLEKFTPYSNHLPGYSFIFYFHGYSLFLCPYSYILETASIQFCDRLSVNVFFPTSCLSLLMHTFLKSIFLVLSFPSNSWSLSPKLPSTITFSAYEI